MRIFGGLFRKPSDREKFNPANIRIASPCPSDWEQMVGNERVRRCSECDLNVYNLSAMTAREIEQLVTSQSGQRLCTRFYRRADGTVLTANCPWSLRTLARKTSRFACAILTAFMSVTIAAAKPKTPKTICDCRQIEHKEPGIRVTITDHDGAVIPNAEITVESKSGREIFIGKTGPAGEWTSGAMAPGEYQVTARANGFRTFLATVVVHEGNLTSLKLKLAVGELKQTVDVTSPSVEVMGTYVIRDPIPIHSTILPPSVLTGQRAPMR